MLNSKCKISAKLAFSISGVKLQHHFFKQMKCNELWVGIAALLSVHANSWATQPAIVSNVLPVSANTSTSTIPVISNSTSGLTASVTKLVTGTTDLPVMNLTQSLLQGVASGSRAISVIDWTSFNIGSAAKVVFSQPSANSVVLNRVTGTTATRIDGAISGNGQVWLLNGNGVMVGPTGIINAAGFLAGTSTISDSAFVSGFSSTSPGTNSAVGTFAFMPFCTSNCTSLGQILNQGQIQVTNSGYVLLGAEQVRNEGVIQADMGLIGLGAGKAFTLSFSGDRTLQFASVDQDVQLIASNTTSNLITSLATNGSDALISNPGKLLSRGGKVAIHAATALGSAQPVVNTTGLINADSVRVDTAGNVFFTNSDVFASATLVIPPVNMTTNPTAALYNGSIEIVGKTSADVINGDIINSGTIRANNNFANTVTTITPAQNQSITLVGSSITNNATGLISAHSVWTDPALDSNRIVSIPNTAVASLVNIYAVNNVTNAGMIAANTPLGTALINVVSNSGSVTNTSTGAIRADGFDGGFVNVITSTNGSQLNNGVISAAALTQLNGNLATSGSAPGLTEIQSPSSIPSAVFANTPSLLAIFSSPSAGLSGTITSQFLATGASGLTPPVGNAPASSASSTTAATAASNANTTTALNALVSIAPALTPLATTTVATAPVAVASQSPTNQSSSDVAAASPKEQPINATATAEGQIPVPLELAQQTATGQTQQGVSVINQQPTNNSSQQSNNGQNQSQESKQSLAQPASAAQGSTSSPNNSPSGSSLVPAANVSPTATAATSATSVSSPPPMPATGATMPPSTSGFTPSSSAVALAKATGQPVSTASPASVASSPVAPAPPSPVGDIKPTTPKDAADSGDKTLAAATPPSITSASAPKRSATKPSTVQVGIVGVQATGLDKTPVANAQEQRFSQLGQSASW